MSTNDENFTPKFYNTSQTATKLNLTDSAVRFYCTKFKDFLNIEIEGNRRRFKKEDIEKLSYIKKLLDENGYTIKQVNEYLSKENISKTNTNSDSQIDEIVSKLIEKFDKSLNKVKDELLQAIDIKFKELIDIENKNKNELIEFISAYLEKKLDDKLNEVKIYNKF